MLFCNIEYFAIFLPIVVFAHFTFGRFLSYKCSLFVLISASWFFYAWWKPGFLILLVCSISINWILGRQIDKQKGRNKKFLILAVIINIAPLWFFKYYNFTLDIFSGILGNPVEHLPLLLPLGISFYTFQQLSFLWLCYKGKKGDPTFTEYILYVSFFPQLIAGPIVYLSEVLPNFRSKNWTKIECKSIVCGSMLFSIGLFKKLVLADTFSVFSDVVYGHDPGSINSLSAWMGAISYYFQIYFDFSGYCDMAIGAALMLNVRLPLNFDSPYRAHDIRDFWRRWHLTLSRWLKHFVYIPLGGNRRADVITYRNIIIVFLLGGLWHGANTTFLLWGALHGITIILYSLWVKVSPIRFHILIGWFLTQLIVVISWVPFRANDSIQAKHIIYKMFSFNGLLTTQDLFNLQSIKKFSIYESEPMIGEMNTTVGIYFIVLVILSILIISIRSNASDKYTSLEVINYWKLGFMLSSILFFTIIMKPRLIDSPFLYFNF